jgi:hypothetical protein
MSKDTLMFNGEELTLAQINEKIRELKALQGLQKEAKKAGLIVAAPRAEKEKSAEYMLLVAAFAPVLDVNADQISSVFAKTITVEDTFGQDSISFKITDKYSVIIRDMDVAKAKKAANEEKKAAERQAELIKEYAEYCGHTVDEVNTLPVDDLKKLIADMLVEKAKLAKTE